MRLRGGQRQARRRRGAGRLRRTALATLVTAAVVVPLSAAGRPEIPAPEPVRFADSATPEARYQTNRDQAAYAADMADHSGAKARADRLRAMAEPGRQFLEFDARGAGRTAEVFGDLRTAGRITVLVPGSDTGIDTYDRFRRGALALYEVLNEQRGPRVAVVAWLGYATPGTISPEVLTTGRADDGAAQLTDFVGELGGLDRPGASVSLLCHSYGSVVCARAAAELPGSVTDIALFGSPGTGADSAADLGTDARLWAGRGTGDWIADVPHVKADLFGTTFGFGTDPTDPAFGARAFAAG
ncbi:alpha/beta hydrolase, partial [Streptomyces sp. T-3]|nr:alpha/beta hydrolase [Streptomyces sp. T-3]